MCAACTTGGRGGGRDPEGTPKAGLHLMTHDMT